VARGDLSDVEWELVEPFLPLGGRGPVPDLRRLFNAVMWRFRTGRPWRDVPQEYGSWSTVYGAFQRWAAAGTFRMLMGGMIAEAAARDQVALDLVSVDSTVAALIITRRGWPSTLSCWTSWRRPSPRKRGLSKGAKHTGGYAGRGRRRRGA
jgi:transposase